jgi:hypothetical protein
MCRLRARLSLLAMERLFIKEAWETSGPNVDRMMLRRNSLFMLEIWFAVWGGGDESRA